MTTPSNNNTDYIPDYNPDNLDSTINLSLGSLFSDSPPLRSLPIPQSIPSSSFLHPSNNDVHIGNTTESCSLHTPVNPQPSPPTAPHTTTHPPTHSSTFPTHSPFPPTTQNTPTKSYKPTRRSSTLSQDLPPIPTPVIDFKSPELSRTNTLGDVANYLWGFVTPFSLDGLDDDNDEKINPDAEVVGAGLIARREYNNQWYDDDTKLGMGLGRVGRNNSNDTKQISLLETLAQKQRTQLLQFSNQARGHIQQQQLLQLQHQSDLCQNNGNNGNDKTPPQLNLNKRTNFTKFRLSSSTLPKLQDINTNSSPLSKNLLNSPSKMTQITPHYFSKFKTTPKKKQFQTKLRFSLSPSPALRLGIHHQPSPNEIKLAGKPVYSRSPVVKTKSPTPPTPLDPVSQFFLNSPTLQPKKSPQLTSSSQFSAYSQDSTSTLPPFVLPSPRQNTTPSTNPPLTYPTNAYHPANVTNLASPISTTFQAMNQDEFTSICYTPPLQPESDHEKGQSHVEIDADEELAQSTAKSLTKDAINRILETITTPTYHPVPFASNIHETTKSLLRSHLFSFSPQISSSNSSTNSNNNSNNKSQDRSGQNDDLLEPLAKTATLFKGLQAFIEQSSALVEAGIHSASGSSRLEKRLNNTKQATSLISLALTTTSTTTSLNERFNSNLTTNVKLLLELIILTLQQFQMQQQHHLGVLQHLPMGDVTAHRLLENTLYLNHSMVLNYILLFSKVAYQVNRPVGIVLQAIVTICKMWLLLERSVLHNRAIAVRFQSTQKLIQKANKHRSLQVFFAEMAKNARKNTTFSFFFRFIAISLLSIYGIETLVLHPQIGSYLSPSVRAAILTLTTPIMSFCDDVWGAFKNIFASRTLSVKVLNNREVTRQQLPLVVRMFTSTIKWFAGVGQCDCCTPVYRGKFVCPKSDQNNHSDSIGEKEIRVESLITTPVQFKKSSHENILAIQPLSPLLEDVAAQDETLGGMNSSAEGNAPLNELDISIQLNHDKNHYNGPNTILLHDKEIRHVDLPTQGSIDSDNNDFHYSKKMKKSNLWDIDTTLSSSSNESIHYDQLDNELSIIVNDSSNDSTNTNFEENITPNVNSNTLPRLTTTTRSRSKSITKTPTTIKPKNSNNKTQLLPSSLAPLTPLAPLYIPSPRHHTSGIPTHPAFSNDMLQLHKSSANPAIIKPVPPHSFPFLCRSCIYGVITRIRNVIAVIGGAYSIYTMWQYLSPYLSPILSALVARLYQKVSSFQTQSKDNIAKMVQHFKKIDFLYNSEPLTALNNDLFNSSSTLQRLQQIPLSISNITNVFTNNHRRFIGERYHGRQRSGQNGNSQVQPSNASMITRHPIIWSRTSALSSMGNDFGLKSQSNLTNLRNLQHSPHLSPLLDLYTVKSQSIRPLSSQVQTAFPFRVIGKGLRFGTRIVSWFFDILSNIIRFYHNNIRSIHYIEIAAYLTDHYLSPVLVYLLRGLSLERGSQIGSETSELPKQGPLNTDKLINPENSFINAVIDTIKQHPRPLTQMTKHVFNTVRSEVLEIYQAFSNSFHFMYLSAFQSISNTIYSSIEHFNEKKSSLFCVCDQIKIELDFLFSKDFIIQFISLNYELITTSILFNKCIYTPYLTTKSICFYLLNITKKIPHFCLFTASVLLNFVADFISGSLSLCNSSFFAIPYVSNIYDLITHSNLYLQRVDPMLEYVSVDLPIHCVDLFYQKTDKIFNLFLSALREHTGIDLICCNDIEARMPMVKVIVQRFKQSPSQIPMRILSHCFGDYYSASIKRVQLITAQTYNLYESIFDKIAELWHIYQPLFGEMMMKIDDYCVETKEKIVICWFRSKTGRYITSHIDTIRTKLTLLGLYVTPYEYYSPWGNSDHILFHEGKFDQLFDSLGLRFDNNNDMGINDGDQSESLGDSTCLSDVTQGEELNGSLSGVFMNQTLGLDHSFLNNSILFKNNAELWAGSDESFPSETHPIIIPSSQTPTPVLTPLSLASMFSPIKRIARNTDDISDDIDGSSNDDSFINDGFKIGDDFSPHQTSLSGGQSSSFQLVSDATTMIVDKSPDLGIISRQWGLQNESFVDDSHGIQILNTLTAPTTLITLKEITKSTPSRDQVTIDESLDETPPLTINKLNISSKGGNIDSDHVMQSIPPEKHLGHSQHPTSSLQTSSLVSCISGNFSTPQITQIQPTQFNTNSNNYRSSLPIISGDDDDDGNDEFSFHNPNVLLKPLQLNFGIKFSQIGQFETNFNSSRTSSINSDVLFGDSRLDEIFGVSSHVINSTGSVNQFIEPLIDTSLSSSSSIPAISSHFYIETCVPHIGSHLLQQQDHSKSQQFEELPRDSNSESKIDISQNSNLDIGTATSEVTGAESINTHIPGNLVPIVIDYDVSQLNVDQHTVRKTAPVLHLTDQSFLSLPDGALLDDIQHIPSEFDENINATHHQLENKLHSLLLSENDQNDEIMHFIPNDIIAEQCIVQDANFSEVLVVGNTKTKPVNQSLFSPSPPRYPRHYYQSNINDSFGLDDNDGFDTGFGDISPSNIRSKQSISQLAPQSSFPSDYDTNIVDVKLDGFNLRPGARRSIRDSKKRRQTALLSKSSERSQYDCDDGKDGGQNDGSGDNHIDLIQGVVVKPIDGSVLGLVKVISTNESTNDVILPSVNDLPTPVYKTLHQVSPTASNNIVSSNKSNHMPATPTKSTEHSNLQPVPFVTSQSTPTKMTRGIIASQPPISRQISPHSRSPSRNAPNKPSSTQQRSQTTIPEVRNTLKRTTSTRVNSNGNNGLKIGGKEISGHGSEDKPALAHNNTNLGPNGCVNTGNRQLLMVDIPEKEKRESIFTRSCSTPSSKPR